jgi:hypothetical protein
LVWSIHHVAIDGWCLAVLLHEALDNYEALRRGEEPRPSPTRPFRDYVDWLLRRGDRDGEGYWRHTLRGFAEPTPLGLDGLAPESSSGGLMDIGEREMALDPAKSAALQDLTRSRRLTISTVIQGAWALLLSRHSGQPDVVFGVTVAGRPPELAGVETMVGMFINTLPLRVAVDESSELVPWLVRLQDRVVEVRRYEATPLSRVQGWSEVPLGQPLFESIVTVQNLPFMDALRERADRLGVESPRYVERTHYPITVTALPDTTLRIKIGFDARRFAADAIERVLGHLRALLSSMADDPEVRLADLPWTLDSESESAPGQRGRPSGEPEWDIEVPDLDRLDEGELDVLLDKLG